MANVLYACPTVWWQTSSDLPVYVVINQPLVVLILSLSVKL